MKKMFYSIVMMAMVCGFMACGNNKTQEGSMDDAIQSEEVAASDENVNVDTTEVVRGGAEGFGRCLESGCYCKAFKGRGQTCQNCGHAYKRHY